MGNQSNLSADAAKAVVRQNTEEVQSRGNFDVFEELFADDFVDHTPQPNTTPDKDGVRLLYQARRAAFPDFHADIHWQAADEYRVTPLFIKDGFKANERSRGRWQTAHFRSKMSRRN